MNTGDPDISDNYMLESMSSSVCNYWGKRELNINTFFFRIWIDVMCYSPHWKIQD